MKPRSQPHLSNTLFLSYFKNCLGNWNTQPSLRFKPGLFFGFLYYGCPYVTRGGVQIQKLNHTKSSTQFECTIATQTGSVSQRKQFPWLQTYLVFLLWRLLCYPQVYEARQRWPKNNCATILSLRLGMGWLQMESRWPYCDLHNKTRNRRVRTWPMHIRDAAAHKALTHSGYKH